MTLLYAIAVGVIMAAGVYMMLDRNVFRIVLGLALISNGVNLLIFLAGRMGPTDPAIIPVGQYALGDMSANPLPQALVLTAIVIGFSLTALSSVLAYEATRALSTLDSDAMTAARDEGDPFEAQPAETR